MERVKTQLGLNFLQSSDKGTKDSIGSLLTTALWWRDWRYYRVSASYCAMTEELRNGWISVMCTTVIEEFMQVLYQSLQQGYVWGTEDTVGSEPPTVLCHKALATSCALTNVWYTLLGLSSCCIKMKSLKKELVLSLLQSSCEGTEDYFGSQYPVVF